MNDDVYVDFMLEGLSIHKKELGYKYRFEPILKTLFLSENLIMVKNILLFILNLLGSFLDSRKRKIIQSELQNTSLGGRGFQELLQIIESRITTD
jgi:hypothetical protein